MKCGLLTITYAFQMAAVQGIFKSKILCPLKASAFKTNDF